MEDLTHAECQGETNHLGGYRTGPWERAKERERRITGIKLSSSSLKGHNMQHSGNTGQNVKDELK